MCYPLFYAHEVLKHWINKHSDSFPPIVIHMTGGKSDDGDPIPYADSIKNLATMDGQILLFNSYFSHFETDSILFPDNQVNLPDDNSRMLFQMSSQLPDSFFQRANCQGMDIQPNARRMSINADLGLIIRFSGWAPNCELCSAC